MSSIPGDDEIQTEPTMDGDDKQVSTQEEGESTELQLQLQPSSSQPNTTVADDTTSATPSSKQQYIIPSFLDILLQTDYRILHLEPPLQANETQYDRQLINLLLRHFWDPKESRAFLNAHEEETGKEFIYGEITPIGTRQLMEDLELLRVLVLDEEEEEHAASRNKEIVFYDLGSGEGKAAVQILLETMTTTKTNQDRANVTKVVGVELSPARHKMAVHCWNNLQQFLLRNNNQVQEDVQWLIVDGGELTTEANENQPISSEKLQLALQKLRNTFQQTDSGRKLHFIHGNLLNIDFSDATHIFASSIFFGEPVLEAMGQIMNKYAQQFESLKIIGALSDLKVLEDNEDTDTNKNANNTATNKNICLWENNENRLQMSWGGANIRLYRYKDY